MKLHSAAGCGLLNAGHGIANYAWCGHHDIGCCLLKHKARGILPDTITFLFSVGCGHPCIIRNFNLHSACLSYRRGKMLLSN